MEVRVYNHRVVVDQMDEEEERILRKLCKVTYTKREGRAVKVVKVKNLFREKDNSFPRGLLYHLSDELEKIKKDIDADFLTTPATHTTKIKPRGVRDPLDNQVTFFEKFLADEEGIGIISSLTGTGKSYMIESILYHLKNHSLVIVPTKAIQKELYYSIREIVGESCVSMTLPEDESESVKDMRKNRTVNYISDDENEDESENESEKLSPERRFLKHKGFRQYRGGFRKVAKAQEGRFGRTTEVKMKPIYILCGAGLNGLSRNFLEKFETIIIDEGHLFGDLTAFVLDNAVNAYFRYFFSATMWRDETHDVKFLSLYSSNRVIYEELPTEAIKKKRVAQVSYQQVKAPKPKIPVDTLFFENGEISKIVKERDIDSVFKKGIICNESRNEDIVNRAVEAVKNGKTPLITVWEEAHTLILKERINALYPEIAVETFFSQMNSKEKERVLSLSKKKTETIFIATMAMGIGADTVFIDVIILGDVRKASAQLLQRNGRAGRNSYDKDKIMEIYDYDDYFNDILRKHSRERKKTIEDFYFKDESMMENKFKKARIKMRRF